MAANQTECTRLELGFVIKFLAAEKCKLCEIYRRMCEAYISVKKKSLLMNKTWVCHSDP